MNIEYPHNGRTQLAHIPLEKRRWRSSSRDKFCPPLRHRSPRTLTYSSDRFHWPWSGQLIASESSFHRDMSKVPFSTCLTRPALLKQLHSPNNKYKQLFFEQTKITESDPPLLPSPFNPTVNVSRGQAVKHTGDGSPLLVHSYSKTRV